MKNFDTSLNYYVYKIEINENVVYVGKGKNQRAWSHLKEAELYAKADNAETENLKCEALNAAKENGDKIEITKIKEHLNEWQALSLEAEYIDFYWDTPHLTNKVRGIKVEKRCAVTFDIDAAETELHYNLHFKSLEKECTFGDTTSETSNVLSFHAAKTLIKMSDIMAINNHGMIPTYNFCVIESVEVICLLDLIGIDVSNAFFISESKDKCEYISSKYGCFNRFNFLGTKMRKFNSIIMNPPFSKDKDFLEKALEVADNVVCIQPASFLYNNAANKHMPNVKPRLNYAIIDDNGTKKYFSANVDSALAISKFNKNCTPYYTLKNGQTNSEYIYGNDDFCSLILNNKTLKTLSEKISSIEKLQQIENNFYVDFSRKLSVNINKNTSIIMGADFYKGMVNGATKIVKEKPKKTCWASFNTEVEAQNAIDFYSLAPVRIVCAYYAGSCGWGAPMVRNAPVVDFKKVWTREMVQERFGITDAEWEYAERVVQGISLDEIE